MNDKIVIIKFGFCIGVVLETNPKILVIEDNEASIRLIQAFLQKNGFSTVVAKNGMSGLEAARTEKPDLIVLDVMLPDLGGHKVCRMIKFDKKLSRIPVVVWTSRDTEQDAETAKLCGADAFVVKTTRIEVMIDIIKKLLAKTVEKETQEAG
jgi:DNA-binding response OmpR family regulator